MATPAPLAHRGVPYWAIAMAVVAAALVLIGGAGWLFGRGGAEVANEPLPATTSMATITTVTPTTAVEPTTTMRSSHLESAQLHLGDEIGFSQSGDTLWVHDGDGNIAGYRDGAWQALPSLPDRVHDAAGTMNGPVWAVTDSNLWYLEDGAWRTLPDAMERPLEADIELDKETGDVWLLSGADLYRWNGVEMTQVGSSSEGMILDGIVVAGDGTIWGARDNFYFPWMDRLARFDEETGAWISVRPLGGTQDLPAAIAVTPDGNLWVGLHQPEALSPDPTEFVLAYLDTTTDEWGTYHLPSGSTRDVVANNEVVWFHGNAGSSDLMRFDGEILAVFSPDELIDNLGLGNDGTLWITIRYERDGVYRLVIDEQPTR